MNDPLIYKLISTASLIAFSLFIWRYSREPWRGQAFGRALMTLAAAVVVYSTATVLRQWLGPDYPGRNAARILANFGLLSTGVTMTIVLWRAQRRH